MYPSALNDYTFSLVHRCRMRELIQEADTSRLAKSIRQPLTRSGQQINPSDYAVVSKPENKVEWRHRAEII
jgi:hypothetical protein